MVRELLEERSGCDSGLGFFVLEHHRLKISAKLQAARENFMDTQRDSRVWDADNRGFLVAVIQHNARVTSATTGVKHLRKGKKFEV